MRWGGVRVRGDEGSTSRELSKTLHWCRCCDGMAFIQEVATDEEWQKYTEGWCPRCLGLCTCRACMRKPHARAAYSAPAHQTEEFAHHVLRYVAPLLADQQRDKDTEV